MATSRDLAARILINYEGMLPLNGKATLIERMEAMVKTVEMLGLEETVRIPLLRPSDDPTT